MNEKFSKIYFSTKEDDEKMVELYNEKADELEDQILTCNIHVDQANEDNLPLIAMSLAVQNFLLCNFNHVNIIVSSKNKGNFRAYCYYDKENDRSIFGILKCLAQVPDEFQEKILKLTLDFSEKDLNQQVLEFVKKSIE
ncbi:MAG: hypothetical protein K5839_01830 [Treponemataceae bacterium]|nr:hypothetical protein [Treponemataceae bacterium]